MVSKSNNIWILIEQGQYEAAYKQITEEVDANPDWLLRHIPVRGICLLHMGHPKAALADFMVHLERQPESASSYINTGIAYWWLGESTEAVKVWRQAVNVKYADAAGGVEIPALLLFAGSRLSDPILEINAIHLLKVKSSTQRNKICPGPIAGFLLDRMDERNLLLCADESGNPTLEKRRKCKADFWIGLSYYRQGQFGKYRYYLQQTLLGSINEPEYSLAKYEQEEFRE